MLGSDIKMALASLRSVKWRSSLTILGIVIGIVSVVTIVSLGNGVKDEANNQIRASGSNLITVRPGQLFSRTKSGKINNVNLAYSYGFGTGGLSDNDLNTVAGTPGVAETSPLSFIPGSMEANNHQYSGGFIVGTTGAFPDLINQKLQYGSYFTDQNSNLYPAVIGDQLSEQLFQENVPIGRTVTIHGQNFIILGIFNQFQPNALALGTNFNNAVFIPYQLSKSINGNNGQIAQILAKPSKPSKTNTITQSITNNLLANHGGQNDFTVLTQSDTLALNSKIFNVLTGSVSGIAAIALLVAGIGIMNIMLVSVTERTREIGVRKALGATDQQLLTQFWVESITLCLIGGLFGIACSLIVNYIIRVFSNSNPVITWPIVILATGVSVVVGVTFGMIPAFKAARKDPIEALRHET